GNVFGLADARVGHERHQAGISLWGLPGRGIDGRADGTGSDGIDADVVGRDLLRDALHHELDATFGARVVGMPRPGNLLVNRAHADDLAGRAGDLWDAPAAQELAHGRARDPELARQVHPDHGVPL